MRCLALCAVLFVAAAAATSFTDDAATSFAAFEKKHARRYRSDTERNYRLSVYRSNRANAEALAAKNPLAVFGDSPFMDLTPEEFTKSYATAANVYRARQESDLRLPKLSSTSGSAALPPFHPRHGMANGSTAPRKWNWRDYPVVTPVKNQGDCGSCWAFSTTGNIEGQWALNRGHLVSLSEQDLVSCCWMSFHCNGGDPDVTDLWLELLQKGKVATEASYPYVSGGGNVPACNQGNVTWGATIDGYFDVSHNETEMGIVAYQHGPISIAVNSSSFQSYTRGIMTNCDAGWFVDHAVLIVGYDDTNSPPYWIVKNSWGASWGEHGYIRIEKGTGQCHLDWFPQSSKVAPGQK